MEMEPFTLFLATSIDRVLLNADCALLEREHRDRDVQFSINRTPDYSYYMSAVNENPEHVIVAGLLRSAEYMRQINSNKSFTIQRKSRAMTIATVVVAAAVTFVGFTGIHTLQRQINGVIHWSTQALQLSYNLMVLAVLILVIMSLIYRLPERAIVHQEAIVRLTRFIRIYELRLSLSEESVAGATPGIAVTATEEYLQMTSLLPPNTDKEYLKAKADYKEKLRKREIISSNFTERNRPLGAASSKKGVDRLDIESILGESTQIQNITNLLATIDGYELWLSGGVIRNAVWDKLHGYEVSTPIDDVDVIWFDSERNDPIEDEKLEELLAAAMPNIKWDVKNQARMHIIDSVPPYKSLEDALEHWPETASAIAVRRIGGTLKIAAPFGTEDLTTLQIRKSPKATGEKFEKRVAEKAWLARWPKLRVAE
jgi:uncharacterized protein